MIKYLRFLSDFFEDYRFSKINPKILTFGHVNRKSIVLGSLNKGNRSVQLLHSYNLFKINIMKNSLKKSPLVAILVCCSIFLMANQSFAQKLSIQKLDNNSVQKETERIVKAQQNLNRIYEDSKNDDLFERRMTELMNSYGIELGFSDIIDFMTKPVLELNKIAPKFPKKTEQFCEQLEKIIFYQTKNKK